ncbi:division/cell wall cluster transcriptional repressor MraZ [Yunchengibacter salinarum]|uniref:division/cell wall cluster transcriptional repressor MraZ n=1 Tax=Yunchengibacter salinarum TaxID=3133399 RepID=UPI0035B6622B
MALFTSTVTNRVDKKGRVSVPAAFRGAVQESSFAGIVLYASLNLPCIEGADMAFLERISDRLYSDYSPYDDDQMAVATAILAGANQLAFDPEGRVMIPAALRDGAGISDRATFVGLGPRFQIWDPDTYEPHRQRQMQTAAKAAPGMMPIFGRQPSAGGPGEGGGA